MKELLVVVSLMALWPFSGAKEYRMTSSPAVPAASGTVKAQKDKNGNMRLDIKVDHLAKPSSLTPPANAYLIWVRPGTGDVVKQGSIRVDDDLKGELKVLTVSRDFDVFITAEQSESVAAPSGAEVLRVHVSPN